MAVHYDELWKNIIEKLFPHFLLYFMPELYADADLTLGYDFLDKELQKIKLKGRRGKKKILEEEIPMAYISGFRQRAMAEGEIRGETKGMMKGMMEGIQGMLEIKFGNVPIELQHKISEISDLAKLESLKDCIKRATDYEQVQKML